MWNTKHSINSRLYVGFKSRFYVIYKNTYRLCVYIYQCVYMQLLMFYFIFSNKTWNKMKVGSSSPLDIPTINPEKPQGINYPSSLLLLFFSFLSSVSKPIWLHLCNRTLKIIHSYFHEHLKEYGHCFESLLKPAFLKIEFYYFLPTIGNNTFWFGVGQFRLFFF